MKHNATAVPSAISVCLIALFVAGGCATSEIRPVEIFPEDNCAQCRMMISDEHFASEIIDQNGEALKFDDLGCMVKYRSHHADLKILAIFLKDYSTKRWIPYERASIVETNVETPMGSGKVAFADPAEARVFQNHNPKDAGAGDVATCCE